MNDSKSHNCFSLLCCIAFFIIIMVLFMHRSAATFLDPFRWCDQNCYSSFYFPFGKREKCAVIGYIEHKPWHPAVTICVSFPILLFRNRFFHKFSESDTNYIAREMATLIVIWNFSLNDEDRSTNRTLITALIPLNCSLLLSTVI